ncbi:MAG: DUF2130 domain-containing protein [Phycisphaerales bacterium]|nr:DUF2130 domain-containing protein [Phycisphaerales bacterium]
MVRSATEQQGVTGEPMITCPKCQATIRLTETLAAPFVERARHEMAEEARRLQETLKAREDDLRGQQEKLELEREAIEARVKARVDAEREKAVAEVRARVMEEVGLQQKDLEAQIAEKSQKLKQAQAHELEFRQKARELEAAKESFELEKQRAVDAAREEIRQEASRDATERFRMKEAEKDKVIGDLREKIEELQRKADQGSQQLQGEVQELELESMLQSAFPVDAIAEVGKGQRGGDCLQVVKGAVGAAAGSILWESKRTKAWSDSWLAKVREDQRQAGAEVAVIVTAALPKGIVRFGQVDGVWVTDVASALPLASALRQMIEEVSGARQATVGRESKMELLYEYMCGPEFRRRVEAIVECFETMRTDLEAEKRAIQKHWGKREKQIGRMLETTASMYGELQGIAGAALPEVGVLGLPEAGGA